MNQKAYLLLCSLSVSAMLFTGCANDNGNNGNQGGANGTQANNAGQGHRIATHDANHAGRGTTGTTGTGTGTGTNMMGTVGTDTDRTGPTEGTTGFGTTGTGAGTAAGNRIGTGSLGNAASQMGMQAANQGNNQLVLELGSIVITGVTGQTRGLGADIGSGMTANGTNSYAGNPMYSNRMYSLKSVTSGSGASAYNTTPTGTTGTGANGNYDTGRMGNQTNTYAGNPMYSNRMYSLKSVTSGSGATAYSTTPKGTGSLGGEGVALLQVTDAKSIQAIQRVNRNLSSSNPKAKATAIAKDIRYILNHAKPMTQTTR
ncbi:hypothetical protein [Paenibacillus xanthanilyticus]|uniref:Lipoprotein n=1 Tax=Paenibacillus xanthanilyticus TaxID=1783531 RepID=A0ABV8K0E7_9BACL